MIKDSCTQDSGVKESELPQKKQKFYIGSYNKLSAADGKIYKASGKKVFINENIEALRKNLKDVNAEINNG